MKRQFGISAIIASFVVGVVGTYTGSQFLGTDSRSDELAKVDEVYNLISDRYVTETDEDALIDGAIQGMVSVLDDPFTNYMSITEASEFEQSLGSSFEGIGAEVSMVDGELTIVSPIKGAPAEAAGLRANDVVLSVNGESLEGLNQTEAINKIRGEKGTTAELSVRRPGVEELMTFKVVRDEIPLTTVYSDVKTENNKPIGYIQITSFSEGTADEFEEQLKELESQNIEGLVIDVRGDGGGYLESVEEIASLLVTGEKPIVQIEERDGETDGYSSPLKEKKDYPISILIDGGTASASEILTGALHEIGGYEVVGETTFGKGTVQSAIELSDGSSLKMTQYKWLTPDGNWIHEKGIEPTVEVKQPDYFYVAPIDYTEELKYDMNNDQIANAQIMLDGLGYAPGRTDGYFNEDTKVAVENFQSDNELTSTGVIDEATATKLQEEIIVAIRDEKNDVQLKTALEVVAQ